MPVEPTAAMSLIPAPDPAALPGPPWLFHALWLVTFAIHLLFLNLPLGGTLLAAASGRREAGLETRRIVVGLNSWAISLTITFGIAPLLFLQVILGRFFYTASILVAWGWLALLLVLTVAYYLNYLAKHRLKHGGTASVILWVEAACFVAVAVIQVAVHLLHARPDRWTVVADRPWLALADPSLLPRLFHFLLAAIAASGALLAWIAVRRVAGGADPALCRTLGKRGIVTALAATALQVVDGFWLLLALPAGVLKGIMTGGVATLLPLTLGIVASIAVLLVLATVRDPLAEPVRVRRGMETIVATVLLMVITRHQVRALYLEPSRVGESVRAEPQWGVFAVFLAAFLLCVGLTVHAVTRSLKDRPARGERAA